MSITLDGSNVNTVGVINSGTAQNSTSGTSIDFTGIPAGVKRITVMFNGPTTNSSGSTYIIQLGSGSIDSSSTYKGGYSVTSTAVGTNANTTGLQVGYNYGSSYPIYGSATLCLLNPTGNIWVFQSLTNASALPVTFYAAGLKSLSGTLDRIRITTSTGTETFNAGSINILYE